MRSFDVNVNVGDCAKKNLVVRFTDQETEQTKKFMSNLKV